MPFTAHLRKREAKSGITTYQIVAEEEAGYSTGKRKRFYRTVKGSKKEAEKAMRNFINELENRTFTKDSKSFVVNIPYEYSIRKANLTVKANNVSRQYGEENPTLPIEYTGFVNSETEDVLTTKPVGTTTATRTTRGAMMQLTWDELGLAMDALFEERKDPERRAASAAPGVKVIAELRKQWAALCAGFACEPAEIALVASCACCSGLRPGSNQCSQINSQMLCQLSYGSISLLLIKEIRQRSTLPGGRPPSTIDAIELNFCVRYGNRWFLNAIATGFFFKDLRPQN